MDKKGEATAGSGEASGVVVRDKTTSLSVQYEAITPGHFTATDGGGAGGGRREGGGGVSFHTITSTSFGCQELKLTP